MSLFPNTSSIFSVSFPILVSFPKIWDLSLIHIYKVGRLLNSCDIYTMVESSIMPCGMESDRYTIIGEILNVVPLVNEISKEPLCQMDVKCNNICIRVLVNRLGLMGEPMVGRRFKGDIWLQGVVNFV